MPKASTAQLPLWLQAGSLQHTPASPQSELNTAVALPVYSLYVIIYVVYVVSVLFLFYY